MTASFPTKLKDPRTCRVFFSSPFGGMEEEREELTRKYFPQIHHLCNSRGIQFVAVDMRWGITSEAAENAQTVNICLRELDRCDIFVGFYGQRYGWHGAEDSKFQQNIENAIGRYPWLKEFRDRSATELEFLHGHLNSPGSLPACFCFRDKTYDDGKSKELERTGNTKLASKYQCESPEASQKLNSLKDRVNDSKDKTLAVHMDYKTPEEGAKQMFDAVWSHLDKVLLIQDSEIPERLQELSDHDAFMASRQMLYIGGEKYFTELDKILETDVMEKVLVTGEAGQGKSSLLANWVSHVKQIQPTAVLAYHFVGASKNSGKKSNILKRLIAEIEEALPEKKGSEGTEVKDSVTEKDGDKNPESKSSIKDQNENEVDKKSDMTSVNGMKGGEEINPQKDSESLNTEAVRGRTGEKNGETNSDQVSEKDENKTDQGKKSKETDVNSKEKEKDTTKVEKKAKTKDIKELMKDLQEGAERSQQEGKLVVMVIDGLDKLVTSGKIAKPLFWLPDTFPKNVKLVVSTLDTDDTITNELVGVRKYLNIKLEDLKLEHRTQICEKTLEKSGKALSKDQLQKVVDKEQTKNPLFLKIIIAELAVFGYFRRLDEKIDDLLTSNSVGDLCIKFLERLESDYNTAESPDIVQQVLKSIEVSHEGLSETEITEMIDIPSHVWSPLYFALEQFIVVHSGLISFAFSELSTAVSERYLNTEEARLSATKCVIKYFDETRKNFQIWPKTAGALVRRPAYELSWLQKKINDKEGLTTTLTDLLVFQTLIVESEYELFELWKSTGHTFSDIADMYIKAFDLAMVYIYTQEKDRMLKQEDEKKPPGQRLMFYLENLRFFMDTASCTDGSTKAIQRIITLLENLEGVWSGKDRMDLLMEHRYYLACNYCDIERFKEARENHNLVIQYWKDGMESGEKDKDLAETRLAWAYNGLGLTHYHLHTYEEAEKLFRESLAIHNKQKNIRNSADSWTNIGLVHLGLKKHAEAIKDFEQSLKLYEEHYYDSVPHVIGNLYTNLGLAYRRSNKLDEAEKYYFKSLELKAKAVGWEHPVIATAYLNLGTLETHRKNYEKVEEYTKKALEIYKVNQFAYEGREYRQCRENMANCYLRQKKYEEAKPYYWSVFDVLTKLNLMKECLAWVHNTMAKHYLDIGDYDNADRILTTLARCPEKRKALTFLYLDQLDHLRPKSESSPRPDDLTLEAGLKIFPYDDNLVKQKMMVHHVSKGDIEGAEEYFTSIDAEAGDYITLIGWCKEDKKPGIAAEFMERALKRFPDVEVVKGEAARMWYDMKHYDKALTLVKQLKVNEEYTEEIDLGCAKILQHFGEEEEARAWLKKVLKLTKIPDGLKTEVAELKEKLGGEAAFSANVPMSSSETNENKTSGAG